jgi:hypothetical protein
MEALPASIFAAEVVEVGESVEERLVDEFFLSVLVEAALSEARVSTGRDLSVLDETLTPEKLGDGELAGCRKACPISTRPS